MKPQWFLLANATHARMLQREPGSAVTVLQTFHHPESRLKTSQLGADAHRKQRTRFARELAQYLERAARDGWYESVVIFSSAPFLGELKQELGDATKRLLSATRCVDLTSVGPAELDRRIRYELAEPAGA